MKLWRPQADGEHVADFAWREIRAVVGQAAVGSGPVVACGQRYLMPRCFLMAS